MWHLLECLAIHINRTASEFHFTLSWGRSCGPFPPQLHVPPSPTLPSSATDPFIHRVCLASLRLCINQSTVSAYLVNSGKACLWFTTEGKKQSTLYLGFLFVRLYSLFVMWTTMKEVFASFLGPGGIAWTMVNIPTAPYQVRWRTQPWKTKKQFITASTDSYIIGAKRDVTAIHLWAGHKK